MGVVAAGNDTRSVLFRSLWTISVKDRELKE